jgi:hypothetical protein
MISAPLRDRFGLQYHLDFYEPEELVRVVTRTALLLETEIDDAGAFEIARRSRGLPYRQPPFQASARLRSGAGMAPSKSTLPAKHSCARVSMRTD